MCLNNRPKKTQVAQSEDGVAVEGSPVGAARATVDVDSLLPPRNQAAPSSVKHQASKHPGDQECQTEPVGSPWVVASQSPPLPWEHM